MQVVAHNAVLESACWRYIDIFDAFLDYWLDIVGIFTVGSSLLSWCFASNVAVRLEPDWISEMHGHTSAVWTLIVPIDFYLWTGDAGLVLTRFFLLCRGGRFMRWVYVVKVENKCDGTVHKGQKDCHSLHVEKERVRKIARLDRSQVSYVLVSFIWRP